MKKQSSTELQNSEFVMTVDYSKTLEQMIAEGKYEYRINDDIKTKNFPLPVKLIGKKIDGIYKIYFFNESISSEDSIRRIAEDGYLPATLPELLKFGEINPEMQRQFPIFALGSNFQYGNSKYEIPVLTTYDFKRRLNLYERPLSWSNTFGFLVVRPNDGILPVPKSKLDLKDVIGLKNLAGWIARYKNFGLIIDEVSPFISELLENGTLSKFEPSLAGLKAGRWGSDEEYEHYEFDAKIKDFIDFGDDWANLHFSFQSNKCMMFVECINESESDKLSRALETIFKALSVEPLTEENAYRDISWEEADKIILKYLKYINCHEIPSVPE